MTYYVKLLGSTDMPMSNEPWDRDVEMHKEVRFPARPVPKEITVGDEFVYYAVGGYKRIFGASRADGEPILNHEHSIPDVAKRWPYAAPITLNPSACLKYVSSGPSLNDITPGLQSKVGHGVSHFEIGKPQFDRAISLLRQAKGDEDRKLKTGWTP